MNPHPLAEMWPLMNPEEYEALKESIKERGLLQPIITFGGHILDGRNRFKACHELKLEPKFAPFHENGRTAEEYIIDTNQRRNLTASQKGVVAARHFLRSISLHPQKVVKDAKGKFNGSNGISNDRRKYFAKLFGVCVSYIDFARVLIKGNASSLEQVLKGEVQLEAAYIAFRGTKEYAALGLRQKPKPGSIRDKKSKQKVGYPDHGIEFADAEAPPSETVEIDNMFRLGWECEIRRGHGGYRVHFFGSHGVLATTDWKSIPCYANLRASIISAKEEIMTAQTGRTYR